MASVLPVLAVAPWVAARQVLCQSMKKNIQFSRFRVCGLGLGSGWTGLSRFCCAAVLKCGLCHGKSRIQTVLSPFPCLLVTFNGRSAYTRSPPNHTAIHAGRRKIKKAARRRACKKLNYISRGNLSAAITPMPDITGILFTFHFNLFRLFTQHFYCHISIIVPLHNLHFPLL